MNQLPEWLSGGDLRSDGLSNQAAAFVLDNPEAFSDLFADLSDPDHVIRGRAADVLEKVARSRPDLLAERLADLLDMTEREQVPMVLMHVAMILGHLAGFEEHVDDLYEALVRLLHRESVFVRSWAIVVCASSAHCTPAGVLKPFIRSLPCTRTVASPSGPGCGRHWNSSRRRQAHFLEVGSNAMVSSTSSTEAQPIDRALRTA